MATTVFGTPITNETLRALPEYANQTKLTQWDRARVAFLLKNAEAKDTKARSFADELRADYRLLGESTGCLIYNATGDRLQLVAYFDYFGRLGRSPYPIFIENGQWGVFLHGRFGAAQSVGAVVYQGYNAQGHKCQWLLSWKNPITPQVGVCYTDIRNPNEEQFSLNTSKEQWDAALRGTVVDRSAGALLSISEDSGCKAFASIGNTNSGLFEAILTITDQRCGIQPRSE